MRARADAEKVLVFVCLLACAILLVCVYFCVFAGAVKVPVFACICIFRCCNRCIFLVLVCLHLYAHACICVCACIQKQRGSFSLSMHVCWSPYSSSCVSGWHACACMCV
jgi:hypothetical protein